MNLDETGVITHSLKLLSTSSFCSNISWWMGDQLYVCFLKYCIGIGQGLARRETLGLEYNGFPHYCALPYYMGSIPYDYVYTTILNI